MGFAEPLGEGWTQAGELGLAFALSSLIGLERELRQKSAGLRTHTIVGVGAALIMLVSKYGFTDVLDSRVILDPSRVAAQIVSGIGFIGGGLIFVRRDVVRGLTTAAVVWLTAGVGMAAGAGLPVLAVLATAGHFVVVFGYTPLAAQLPRSKYAPSQLAMTFREGSGVVRLALAECTQRGFTVSRLSSDVLADQSVAVAPADGEGSMGRQRDDREENGDGRTRAAAAERTVSVVLQIHGRGSVTDLAAVLSEIDGMLTVSAGDVNTASE
ncbi:MAG: MgtC/SapB family protein [Acidothermaceae bacterium]